MLSDTAMSAQFSRPWLRLIHATRARLLCEFLYTRHPPLTPPPQQTRTIENQRTNPPLLIYLSHPSDRRL